MSGPTGLGAFADRFPDRIYDVGIAEQHALTSAAGLAMGGMHPVVALYCHLPEPRIRSAADGLRLAPAGRDGGAGPRRDHRRGRTEPPWHVGHVAGCSGARAGAGGPPRRADARRGTGRGRRGRRWSHSDPLSQRRCAATCYRSSAGRCQPRSAGHCRGRDRGGRCARPSRPPDRTRTCCWWRSARSAAMAVDAAARLADQGIGVTVVDPRWALPVPACPGGAGRSSTGWSSRSRTGAGPAELVPGVSRRARSARDTGDRAGPAAGVPRVGVAGDLLSEFGLNAKDVARGITEMIAGRATSPAVARSGEQRSSNGTSVSSPTNDKRTLGDV